MSAPVVVAWGMGPTIQALSANLVNELRMAGFPELDGGGILWGKTALANRKAAPSIVAIWSPSGATGAYWGHENQSVGPRALLPNGGRPVQPVMNSLATDLLRIDFHVWGAANPPDPTGFADADMCRYLCHQLWRVIHRGAEGAYRVLGTDPLDQPPTGLGAEAVLRVEFSAPVVDNLISYVAPGTFATVVVSDAQGEVAASFPTPGVN